MKENSDNMKKIISILMVLAICLSLFSTFAFAAPQFADVKTTAWYYDSVQWAVKKGVTSGTTPTTFSPTTICTRSQAVTFLWNANGNPAPTSAKNPFKDVKAGAWYYDAVLWAVEKGITSGTTPTTFEPNANCDRSQIVTFLWNSQKNPDPTSTKNPFKDVKSGAWYYDAVLWAVEKGITSGTTPTTFAPTTKCDRAQIVTFLFNFMSKNQTPSAPVTPDTPDTPEECSHTYDNDCDSKCNKCGAKRTVPAHVYDNDCDSKCNECGAKRTVAAHVYDNDCDSKCNECGAKRTAPHKYDFDCDKECNLCGATRNVKHIYPSNPNGTYSKCACGLSHISIPGPITTDKDFVAAGEKLTASVSAKDGLAPYTFKWQYKNATGWHTIEGKTTKSVTFTVTEDMFDADKKLVLYVNASDADGYTASPMDYKIVGALGILEVSFNEIAQVDDNTFMSRPGSSDLLGVLPVYVNVKNANPNDCTYKWEYSRKKDSDFKEIPTDSAGFNTHGISYTDPNYDSPAFMIKKSFLDTPVYIRVTVTSPDHQTVTVVSGPAYRELKGSTGSSNFLVGSSDPQFAVTPYGGNGEYTYKWGYVFGGLEYIIGDPGEQYVASKFQNYNTSVLTITRSNYNSMHITQMFCIIRSAGTSEKVYVNFN